MTIELILWFDHGSGIYRAGVLVGEVPFGYTLYSSSFGMRGSEGGR